MDFGEMVRRVLIFIAALVALCGCQHKDLCYMHSHTVPVRVHVDWEKFNSKEVPTGMTVMAFQQGGGNPVKVLSNVTTHADIHLTAGVHHTVVFNQSVTEFGSLEFRNMESYDKAEVIAGPAPTKWYTTKHKNEKTAHEPEWFGTSKVEGTEITNEMIDKVVHASIQGARGDEFAGHIHHTPKNVIYTLKVTVHIKNIYNLRSARAAISGMAEGYMIGKGDYSTTQVTHLLEKWTLGKDETDPTRGYIQTTIQCFGLPAGHKGTAAENTLNLELLLADNKTQLNAQLAAGDKFVKVGENGELKLHLTIELADPLPDVKPEGGSSGGFDATVTDWGDEIEHEIQM